MFLLFLMSLIEDEKYSQFFHHLYTKYRQKMFYAAWQVLRNPQTAEDAMQDTFYVIASNDRVLERLMKLNEESELYLANYITKMCKNNAIQKASSTMASRERAADFSEDPIVENLSAAENKFMNPEDILCSITDRELMRNAMHRLSETDEELLHLLYFQNFSMDEIAEQLQITKNALYVRHHRALKALSVILKQQEVSV